MTEETKKPDIFAIQNENGEAIFRITNEGIYVSDKLEVDEVTRMILEKLGGYVLRGVAQGIEGELNRLRATCWSLLEERNALAAQIQAMQQPQKLDA